MLAMAVPILLVSVFAKDSAMARAGYANDLCISHNRFLTRVACSQVASALQSGGADRNKIERLMSLLKTGDHREALKVADDLRADLKSAPVTSHAAVEYVRSVMLHIEDSGDAAAAAKNACSLFADERYCLFYVRELIRSRQTAAARSLCNQLLERSEEPGTEADPLFQVRVLL